MSFIGVLFTERTKKSRHANTYSTKNTSASIPTFASSFIGLAAGWIKDGGGLNKRAPNCWTPICAISTTPLWANKMSEQNCIDRVGDIVERQETPQGNMYPWVRPSPPLLKQTRKPWTQKQSKQQEKVSQSTYPRAQTITYTRERPQCRGHNETLKPKQGGMRRTTQCVQACVSDWTKCCETWAYRVMSFRVSMRQATQAWG